MPITTAASVTRKENFRLRIQAGRRLLVVKSVLYHWVVNTYGNMPYGVLLNDMPMMAMIGIYMNASTMHRHAIIVRRKALLVMRYHLRSLSARGWRQYG